MTRCIVVYFMGLFEERCVGACAGVLYNACLLKNSRAVRNIAEKHGELGFRENL